MEGREISHSVLTIVHVFFTNIILMNYLIAILSSTYEKMKQSGVFSFKQNLYSYCERYILAFSDRAYGEMVLHPPPLSYISIILLPFLPSRKAMETLSTGVSYIMYWLENIAYLLIFFILNLALAPFAYLKVWINVITNSSGFCNILLNCFVWSIAGIPIMIYLACKDLVYFFSLLTYH